jgi:antibiotic biosynthesis monooxygenase (ABM) superfamily enzyme
MIWVLLFFGVALQCWVWSRIKNRKSAFWKQQLIGGSVWLVMFTVLTVLLTRGIIPFWAFVLLGAILFCLSPIIAMLLMMLFIGMDKVTTFTQQARREEMEWQNQRQRKR